MMFIIILFSILIISLLIIYLRKESFVVMGTKDIKLIDKTFTSDDFSINNSGTTDPNSSELINYLDSNIQKKNTKSSNNLKLPLIGNNTQRGYNHALRIINNSKKIKQEFIINILKGQINVLLGSLNNFKKK